MLSRSTPTALFRNYSVAWVHAIARGLFFWIAFVWRPLMQWHYTVSIYHIWYDTLGQHELSGWLLVAHGRKLGITVNIQDRL